MKNVRLVVNILILVLVPIILNRQKIMNYIGDSGIPEKSGNALNSIKQTSSKTFKGAKNISSSVYSSTKHTIETVNTNVGDKVEEMRSKDNVEIPVPKILKSQKDIDEIKNINIHHEKEIGTKMLENIAKLNEEKVAAHRGNEESLESGQLHEKHKRALDSKAVDFTNEVAQTDKNEQKDEKTLSLFEKHRELNEKHIQKIGRKTGI